MPGRVWPLNFVWACFGCFCRDWPLVALNPYRYAVYIVDVCLSYVVSSGFEVNMSCRLIFIFVEAFNQLVCSRREFSKKLFTIFSRTLRYERRDMF